MANNYFPHNSRVFSAGFLGLAIWTLLVGFFLLNFIPLQKPLSSFDQLKLAVLKNPENPAVHLALAKEYLAVNDPINAEREILIGLSFAPQDQGLEEALVEIKAFRDKPRQIQSEIQKWEKIAQDFPGYRDAYLKLAQLHYTIYQNKESRENLDKALEIDPNFEPAGEMKKILRDAKAWGF